MPPKAPVLDLRDFWCLAPAVILTVWGLIVVLADLGWFRRLDRQARSRGLGRLTMLGVGAALVMAMVQFWIDATAVSGASRLVSVFGDSLGSYFARQNGLILMGTLAQGLPMDVMNIVFLTTLTLVVWMAVSYTYTEDLGELLALLLWATVGMMMLTAAEELAVMFVSLETMTICLYLASACEKSRIRSPEAGLKYFVYGSVSSALFLYGLSLVYGLSGTTYFDAIGRGLAQGAERGLTGNLAGGAALLLILVGFGFKIAAVPFQQWAPDVYEGAPAPVAAWIATGSKIASFVAMTKVFVHALGPWSNPTNEVMGPGWLGLLAAIAAATMTYGNLAALAQTNLKRMLAYSSIAHAGYLLVGVAAVSVSTEGPSSAGAILYYLIVYAFANLGAFSLACWTARDRGGDAIADLDGLGRRSPLLAVCVVVLMLSLIGIPPFGGFFGKLYIFMEALRQRAGGPRIVLTWLVALGLFNSVVSAFYYVRVLKAMYLRPSTGRPLMAARSALGGPIIVSAVLVTLLGIAPGPLVDMLRSIALPMLTAKPQGEASALSPPAPMKPVAWSTDDRTP